MDLDRLQPGDVIYAATTIVNDGGMPDMPESAVIAAEGTRGVLINVGHLEEDPNQEVALVRFEGSDGELGPPTGCWPEELREEIDSDLREGA